jgi:hypothetical protein
VRCSNTLPQACIGAMLMQLLWSTMCCSSIDRPQLPHMRCTKRPAVVSSLCRPA